MMLLLLLAIDVNFQILRDDSLNPDIRVVYTVNYNELTFISMDSAYTSKYRVSLVVFNGKRQVGGVSKVRKFSVDRYESTISAEKTDTGEIQFAFKEKEAFELYKAEQIVVEIQRRAIKGIDEPIYWKGKIVGYTRKFSDKLLLALAKRHIDGFKDHLKVDQKTELSGAVEVSMDVLGQFDEESLRDMKRILAREAARKSQPEEDD